MKNNFIKLFGMFFVIAGVRYGDKKVFEKRNRQLALINAQNEVLDHWLTMKERNISILDFLNKNQYTKIGIYGLSMLGNHLYEELYGKKEIKRLIGIDRSNIHDNYNMKIYKPEDNFEDIDLIIVTAVLDFESIVNVLEKKHKVKIMSIQQVINECEKFYSYLS